MSHQPFQDEQNIPTIRKLLTAAFSDEDFTIFCYDHFQDVYENFASGMTFRLKVQLLIEYCVNNNLLSVLLPLVGELNPNKYAEFAPSLQEITKRQEVQKIYKGSLYAPRPLRVLLTWPPPASAMLRRRLDAHRPAIDVTTIPVSELKNYLVTPDYYHVLLISPVDWRTFTSILRHKFVSRVNLLVLGPDPAAFAELEDARAGLYFPSTLPLGETVLILAILHARLGQRWTLGDCLAENAGRLAFTGIETCWPISEPVSQNESPKSIPDSPVSFTNSGINIGTINVRNDMIIGNKTIYQSEEGQVKSKEKETTAMAISTDEQVNPTIGIITALEKEYVAVEAMLENPKPYYAPGRGSGRRYLLGEIPATNGGQHSVVLALADMGNNVASTRATLLLEHFSNVDAIIMVGIAGGVPYPQRSDEHVRLGDIVVSNQQGIIQYDFIKEAAEQVTHRHSPRPPKAGLLEAVRLLKAAEMKGDHPWLKFIERAAHLPNTSRPLAKTDILQRFTESGDPILVPHPKDRKRQGGKPRIFIGPIASANTLLKNPSRRDALRDKFGVKAIEMEGSGIADATWHHEVGYLVIRGICDYCDPNKNDLWQEYAAVAAAAYTRALLESMPASSIVP